MPFDEFQASSGAADLPPVEAIPEDTQEPGGGAVPLRDRAAAGFPPPIPISEFAARAKPLDWIWEGYILRRAIALLTGFWKSGKTTLLNHLLRCISAQAPDWLGRKLNPCKVLLVTQEDPMLWQERMELFNFNDHLVSVQTGPDGCNRPFLGLPSVQQWRQFCAHLASQVKSSGYGLVVIDPVADFWPVADENMASQVTQAIQPLRQVTEADAGVLLLHHPRKSGGDNGTAHRGSGQLAAIADVLLEFKKASSSEDETLRILSVTGRFKHPPTLCIRLTESEYQVCELPKKVPVTSVHLATLRQVLPNHGPGLTVAAILKAWPTQPPPDDRRLRDLLTKEVEGGRVQVDSTGKAKRYWLNQEPTQQTGS